MSNQQTVAVVVGVSVLLGVGALVADHLSAAQQASLEDVARAESPAGEANDPEADGFVARALPESWLTAGRAFAETTTVASADLVTETDAGAAEPIDAAPIEVVRADQAQADAATEAPDVADLADPKPLPEPLVIVTGETGGAESNADPATGERAGGSEHRVARGESLFKIAERRLGDGNKWRLIAEANPGSVGPKGQVIAGVVLTIPSVDGPGATAPTEPEPEPLRTYRVRRGETLSQIAMRELGTIKRQREILKLNSDRIDSPDKIRAGMELLLPSVG